MTTLKLLYGNRSGVGFEIYEPQNINAYTDTTLSPVIGLYAGNDSVRYRFVCDEQFGVVGRVWRDRHVSRSHLQHQRVNDERLVTVEGKGVCWRDRLL